MSITRIRCDARNGARIATALLAVLAVAGLAGCKARTDRALYGAGDGGSTFLENGSDRSIEVDCTVHLDQAVDGAWVPGGEQTLDACRIFFLSHHAANTLLFAPIDGEVPIAPDLTIALPELDSLSVPPGGRIHSSFRAPQEPGQWRVRYSVGLGCRGPDHTATVPDAECSFDHPVETPAFGVEEFCALEECVEEPPVCEPDPILALSVRSFAASFPEDELVSPLQSLLVPLNMDPSDGLISRPVPFFPHPIPFPRPFPVPTSECRRDLETKECRWVCDDAHPTPPPHGY